MDRRWKMKLDDSYIARRRFLGSMIGGGAAALGAGVALPVTCYVGNLRKEPPPDFMWVETADFELAPGTSRLIQYGRIPVILIQPPGPDEELRVLLATCTHFDCTVSYEKDANDIVCACHDGHYTIDGEVVSGPPPRPLRHFFTKLHGDRLVIALEKENLEKAFAEPDA
jgi:Rieske Fe-S protein